MTRWLEKLVAAAQAAGAKAVRVADYRAPLFEVAETDLPLVVISLVSSRQFGGIPGNPLAITTIPSTSEEWEYDCQLTWWAEWQHTLVLDVYGDANVPWTKESSAYRVAEKVWEWLCWTGRDDLRLAKARVIDVSPVVRAMELPAGLESAALERWTLEAVIGTVVQSEQVVETVEAVSVTGFEAGTGTERTFEVREVR